MTEPDGLALDERMALFADHYDQAADEGVIHPEIEGWGVEGGLDQPAPNGSHAQPAAADRGAWEWVDVAAVLANDPGARAAATVLLRSDGVGLLYAGRINSLAGEAESLKTWLALVACAQELRAGRHVLYLDFEDDAGSVIRSRLHHDLGVPADRLTELLHYVRPDEPITTNGARARLLADAAAWSPTLAVVDGITEALSLHGLSSNADVEIASLTSLLTRPLADLGAAVAGLDHVAKDPEQRGRYAIGSQHKLSAVSGAAYGIQSISPARRGTQDGLSRLVVAKDRPGGVRPHATAVGTVADFRFGSDGDGLVSWRLDPPDVTQATEPFRPTHLMERVSRYLEDATEDQSQRAIVRAVRGKDEAVIPAIRCLVAEGFVATSVGENRAVLHRSERPFRELQ